MLGLTGGELFVIGFILSAILTARFWPALGERIVLLFAGSDKKSEPSDVMHSAPRHGEGGPG